MVVTRAHPESLRWCEATTVALRTIEIAPCQYRLNLFPMFSLEIWNAGREPHSSYIPDKQYGVLARKRGKRRQDIIDSGEIPIRLECGRRRSLNRAQSPWQRARKITWHERLPGIGPDAIACSQEQASSHDLYMTI